MRSHPTIEIISVIKAKNSRLQELQVSIKILCNMYDPEST